MKTYLMVLVILVTSLSVDARRRRGGPKAPDVRPLIEGNMRYTYKVESLMEGCENPTKFDCGGRIYLVAIDMNGDKEKWKTEIYQKIYKPRLDYESQIILPKSMRFVGHNIEVVDEKSTKYIVTKADGQMITPKEVKVYPAKK